MPSLRTLLLSRGSQGGVVTQVHRVTETHSWISVLPLAQVTSTERNEVLDSHPILPLFLHTLHPLRRISCQIISFLNLQASGINVQSCDNRMISLSRRIFTLIEQNSFV